MPATAASTSPGWLALFRCVHDSGGWGSYRPRKGSFRQTTLYLSNSAAVHSRTSLCAESSSDFGGNCFAGACGVFFIRVFILGERELAWRSCALGVHLEMEAERYRRTTAAAKKCAQFDPSSLRVNSAARGVLGVAKGCFDSLCASTDVPRSVRPVDESRGAKNIVTYVETILLNGLRLEATKKVYYMCARGH